MSEHTHSPTEHSHSTTSPAAPTHSAPAKKQFPLPPLAIGIIVLLLAGGVYYYFNSSALPGAGTGNTTLSPSGNGATNLAPTSNVPLGTTPEQLRTQLSKAKFQKKVFEVHRETYDLFGQAAKNMNMTLEDTKTFFYQCCGLTSEADIFSNLPAVPNDFSTVAFDVATGNLYQIAYLDKSYWAQPEFLFYAGDLAGVNRKIAFGAWEDPHLEQWGDSGLTTYPSDEYDTLTPGTRDEFVATVFVYAGWNVQNYQGIYLIPDSESLKHFDISIEADDTGKPYFLLDPTFPQFGKNWARKVIIHGKLKPGTPSGVYDIGINDTTPPKELNDKWTDDHKGLYSVAAQVFRASGNQITLHVTVQ